MANYQAGFQAKLSINNYPFAVQRYAFRDTAPRQDVSNTEGFAGNPAAIAAIGYSAVIGGLRQGEGNFTGATFDALSNPFLPPFSLQSQIYVAIRLWTNTRGGVSWQSPSFYVENTSSDGDVRNLQPFNFSGVTDSFSQNPIA